MLIDPCLLSTTAPLDDSEFGPSRPRVRNRPKDNPLMFCLSCRPDVRGGFGYPVEQLYDVKPVRLYYGKLLLAMRNSNNGIMTSGV
jgi:hypothetical protein